MCQWYKQDKMQAKLTFPSNALKKYHYLFKVPIDASYWLHKSSAIYQECLLNDNLNYDYFGNDRQYWK